MRIALGSIFRNSANYVDRYGKQVAELRAALESRGDVLRLILAEGDSIDGTWTKLQYAFPDFNPFNVDLFKREHGGKSFVGSPDDATRWRQISYACDGVFERVRPEDDAVIYVESDIIWQIKTMLTLLQHLDSLGAVSPMCFLQSNPEQFYDTWGYRKDGLPFASTHPYHYGITDGVTSIDSAGSCIVMRGEAARRSRFNPPHLGIRGFCLDLKANGYTLHLDPSQKVMHP